MSCRLDYKNFDCNWVKTVLHAQVPSSLYCRESKQLRRSHMISPIKVRARCSSLCRCNSKVLRPCFRARRLHNLPLHNYRAPVVFVVDQCALVKLPQNSLREIWLYSCRELCFYTSVSPRRRKDLRFLSLCLLQLRLKRQDSCHFSPNCWLSCYP